MLTHVRVHMCMLVSMYVCGGLRPTFRVFLVPFPPYSLRRYLPIEPGRCHFSTLPCQFAPGSSASVRPAGEPPCPSGAYTDAVHPNSGPRPIAHQDVFPVPILAVFLKCIGKNSRNYTQCRVLRRDEDILNRCFRPFLWLSDCRDNGYQDSGIPPGISCWENKRTED